MATGDRHFRSSRIKMHCKVGNGICLPFSRISQLLQADWPRWVSKWGRAGRHQSVHTDAGQVPQLARLGHSNGRAPRTRDQARVKVHSFADEMNVALKEKQRTS